MKLSELIEHPEGGRFSEVFRSTRKIITDEGANRSALTHIYFSLNEGEVSRFHRVLSDEVWNLYRGEGLILYLWQEGDRHIDIVTLSANSNTYCHVVPAGYWQAAEPVGESVLVGCSVGPGFEFEDFELIEPESSTAEKLIAINPNVKKFV